MPESEVKAGREKIERDLAVYQTDQEKIEHLTIRLIVAEALALKV